MEIKKKWNAISAFLNRYINGTKGAISLFLALLMTPILTLSLILVESSRYQSIVQLVEEISDLCGFSTLAEYDPYVEDRFGFLSVEQEQVISDIFKESLKANQGMLGDTATLLDTSTASGVYALSDDEVLLQQILEQSEISVLSKTIVEGLDIDDLLEQISEAAKLDKLENLMEQGEFMKTFAELTKTVTELINGLKELIEADNAADDAYTAYKRAYSKPDENGVLVGFGPDMFALVEALKTAEAALPADADADDVYDDSKVKEAIENLKKSQSTYRSKAEALEKALDDLSSKTSAVHDTIKTLGEKMSEFRVKESAANGEENFEPGMTDAIIVTLTYVYDLLDSAIKESSVDSLNNQITDLQAQIRKLKNLRTGDFKSVPSSWTEADIKREYGPLKITYGFIQDVKTALGRLEADFQTDDSLLKKLIDLLNKIMDIQAFYDMSLDSVVSTSNLHQTSDPDLEDLLLITSIQTFCTAVQKLEEALEDDGFTAFWKFLEALGTAAVAIAEFLVAVIGWALDFVTSVVTLIGQAVVNPAEWYNRLLLCGYCAYNMPNRTNCTTGKALCGYDYQKVFLSHGGSMAEYDSRTLGGSFSASLSNSGGVDTGFKGATMEYITVGSMSEYENQFTVFFRLMLFRFVLNLLPVFQSSEWGATPIYVKLIISLCEGFLDTLFLVNGQSEYLVKTELYISAENIDKIITKLSAIVAGGSASTLVGAELKKDKEKDKDKDKDKGGDNSFDLFKCTYGDHLYLMMFISYKKEKIVDRVQNVVQMDADKFYEDMEGYSFDLDHAYTHIYSTVDYQLNPMFKIDALSNGGIFDVSVSRYTGY